MYSFHLNPQAVGKHEVAVKVHMEVEAVGAVEVVGGAEEMWSEEGDGQEQEEAALLRPIGPEEVSLDLKVVALCHRHHEECGGQEEELRYHHHTSAIHTSTRTSTRTHTHPLHHKESLHLSSLQVSEMITCRTRMNSITQTC